MFRPRAPRRMAAGAALVLALHALLALLLPTPRPDPPAVAPSAPALVWLLPMAPADAPPAAQPAPAARTAAAPRTAAAEGRTEPTPRPPAREAQAITLPAPAARPPGPPAEAPVAAPALPTAAERLNLELPRGASAPWRARQPALDDPRLARDRRTLEAAIAAALGGDDRVVEERLDADRVRLRSGSRCVLLKRSRAGQLDLAGGAFRDLWAASEC